jgi:exonuclease-1
VVFDGFDLHAKKDTKKKREEKRARYIKKRDLAKEEGRLEDYIKFKNYSMTIEKKHILLLMDYLNYAKVEFVVSPFEADAQLAYMHKIGQIDYVITEDSDLVLYDCENLINKLNQSGYCELLQIKNDTLMYNNSDTEEVEDFVRLTQEQKIWMALMVGCDYLEKVRGVGLKKGIMLIQNVTSLKMLFNRLKEKCKRFNNTPEYKTAFKNCELVFKFQKVYNSKTKELCYFQEPDEHMLKHMQSIPNLEHYVGHDIPNLRQHVQGYNIKKLVPPSEKLFYDFKSLEYKIDNKTSEFKMNQISNLVMHDPNSNVITKDDFEIYLSKKGDFYEEGLEDKSLVISDDKSKGSPNESTSKKSTRGSRFKNGYQRRSKSNDLPSENSIGVSVKELERSIPSPKRKSGKTSVQTRRSKRMEMKKKEVKDTDSIMKMMLEASFPTPEKKPSGKSESTKFNSQMNTQRHSKKEKLKEFPQPRRRSRRTFEKSTQIYSKLPPRFKLSKMGSGIIEMEDLLEAEESRKNVRTPAVNISYHTLCLRNEEEEKEMPQVSKILYSKARSLKKKMQKKSRISKFSQNMKEEEFLIEDLEFIQFSSSEENIKKELLSKRNGFRKQNTRRLKRQYLAKKVKYE